MCKEVNVGCRVINSGGKKYPKKHYHCKLCITYSAFDKRRIKNHLINGLCIPRVTESVTPEKIVTVMTYAAGTSCHVVLRPKTAGKRNARNIYFSVLFGSPHKSYYIDYGRVIVTYNVDKNTHFCDCNKSKCVHCLIAMLVTKDIEGEQTSSEKNDETIGESDILSATNKVTDDQTVNRQEDEELVTEK